MGDERAPWARKRSASEQRKRDAELLYELEMEFRRVGWAAQSRVRAGTEREGD